MPLTQESYSCISVALHVARNPYMGASDHISAFDDDIPDMIAGHDSAWVPAVLLEPPLKLSPEQRAKDI
jgi:hypothetical protein